MKDSASFKYTVNPEVDEIIDEKGNTVILFRKLAWGEGEEKLELRKWYVDIDKETPNKGVVFLTEEGPNNLVHTFINKGFGDTERILTELKEREDFESALCNIIGESKIKSIKKQTPSEEVEYFDPKTFMAG